jgi:hypothetical protein
MLGCTLGEHPLIETCRSLSTAAGSAISWMAGFMTETISEAVIGAGIVLSGVHEPDGGLANAVPGSEQAGDAPSHDDQ